MKKILRIGVEGATGYLGALLIELLKNEPYMRLAYCASSTKACGDISKVEIMCLALPPEQSAVRLPYWRQRGKRVIDLSGAFRLKRWEDYRHWYGWFFHPHAEFLGNVCYGLPERNRHEIRACDDAIAMPGCYATAMQLGLMPMTRGTHVWSKIIVRAVSGYTGAGKDALIPEGITLYKPRREHQHVIEVEGHAPLLEQLRFYPHVAPFPRGIWLRMICETRFPIETIGKLYEQQYAQEPFVHLVQDIDVQNVLGTNHCHITIRKQRGRLIIEVVLDNLMKGGSGQALQVLRLMAGVDEATGR